MAFVTFWQSLQPLSRISYPFQQSLEKKKKNTYRHHPPSRLCADEEEDAEGEPLVEVPVFDGRSYHDAANENHVHVRDVVAADFLGLLDTEDRKEKDGEERRGGHRDAFGHPVDCHDDDAVPSVANLCAYFFGENPEQNMA